MSPARPPYDPELSAYLEASEFLSGLEFTLDGIPQLRESMSQSMPTLDDIVGPAGLEHIELTVPGPEGVPEVILSVIRRPGGSAAAPCVYYIHGGGMIIGDRSVGADSFPEWIERFGVTVVSVEYRLAPEHPHPAPVEDCYAGLVWVAEHAAELGVDRERVLVAGTSAGGGLAAAVALLCRDRGGPRLVGQLLICPMLDDRDRTVSTRQYEDVAVWNRAQNTFGWTALLGTAKGTDDVPAYAAPARATDLSGLPPAFIDTGSAEVFRDEDVDYASRIWAAGGQAELHVWAGGFHGFALFREATVSRGAVDAVHNWMGRVLNS
ncbi:alpha/beta hydrolase [Streptomyces sp. NPDC059477]|uniref:alpha/beta hydrolase n=1 Tax=Streptomyces sp. NPDC059477 TaxID=3346847 RepID=UPI0036C2F222